jgi:predicted P-loop ATPase
LNAIPATPIDLSPIITKYFPNAAAPVVRLVTPDAEKSFFQRVNDHAMADLAAWVRVLLPMAQRARQGYRVRSVDLGRRNEEDLSIQPEGIVDFGVHDLDDPREGKRTPIELVVEWHDDRLDTVKAAHWLCEQLGVEPAALGWKDSLSVPLGPDEFDALDPVLPTEEIPGFERNKQGKILASIENTCKAVAAPGFTGWRVAFDQFRDETMMAPVGTDDWRPLQDADYTELRILLERRDFKPVSKDMARDAVEHATKNARFDSAIMWLSDLKWDGVKRIDTFWSAYFGADDTAYSRAVARYTWSALAGRVMDPGVKADMMPILVGRQGAGKSSGVAAMVPSPDHFFEADISSKEDDLARRMRGRLIAEVGELRGLQSREIEHIKALLTRTHENWVPKFKEFAVTFPRRCIFIGTTNQEAFLGDDTGERRFLPLRTGTVDRDAVARDRLQLWAEARHLFAENGVVWAEAETLANGVHDQHKLVDPWVEDVATWLDALPEFGDADAKPIKRGMQPFTTSELLAGLGIETRNKNNAQDKRAASVLRTMGYTNKPLRVGGILKRVWVKQSP